MAAAANFAVEMGIRHLRPSIAFPDNRFAQNWHAAQAQATVLKSYDTIEAGPPSVTSTISGGTPSRNGTMLQPRPPETMTSQFILIWPYAKRCPEGDTGDQPSNRTWPPWV